MTRLADMSWPEASEQAGRGAVLLLPVGATEQHGPHLPLTTDTDLAVAVAERAVELDGRAIVAPALAFGSSGEHDDFAGTLSIGTHATEQVLVELARSASLHFSGLVMVSTHGGNLEALRNAVRGAAIRGPVGQGLGTAMGRGPPCRSNRDQPDARRRARAGGHGRGGGRRPPSCR